MIDIAPNVADEHSNENCVNDFLIVKKEELSFKHDGFQVLCDLLKLVSSCWVLHTIPCFFLDLTLLFAEK